MTGKGTIAFPGSVAFGFSFSTSLVKTATPKDMYGVAYVPVAKSTVTMWVTQGVPPRCRVTPVKRAVPIDRSKGNLGSPTSLILLGRRESGSSLLVSGSMQAKPDPDLVIGRDCHDRYSPTNASFFQTMVSGGTFGGAWGIDGAVVPLVAGEPFPTVRGKTSSRFAEGWPLLTATWTISPSR